jgi:hypothetical protein
MKTDGARFREAVRISVELNQDLVKTIVESPLAW